LRALAKCHLLAILALAAVYWGAVRGLVVGGAPDYVMANVVAETLALCIGVYTDKLLATWIAALLAAGLAVAGIVTMARQGDNRWVFFAVMIFVAPMCILVPPPRVLFPRFFYVSTVFYLVLLAYLIGRVWQRRPVVAAGALLAITAANCWQLAPFLRDGRGQYQEAIAYMVDHTEANTIEIGSDHDFRNLLILRFYSQYLPAGRAFDYHGEKEPTPPAPEWYIVHESAHDFAPASEFLYDERYRYRLAAVFPYAGLSGFNWAVYHLQREPESTTRH